MARKDQTEIRIAVLTAAADALDAFTHDSTGSSRYNSRRAYDRGFGKAMDELRHTPVADRPDGLVAEVDELVAIVHNDSVAAAVGALRDRVNDYEITGDDRDPTDDERDFADTVDDFEAALTDAVDDSTDDDDEPRLMTDGGTSAHSGVTLRCGGTVTDDDGEPVENEWGNPTRCDRELTFDDHGRFVRHLSGDLRERFTSGAALRFECPDCSNVAYRCPICSDPDDHAPPGWFTGDSTGKQLACTNCNPREAARQDRDPYF